MNIKKILLLIIPILVLTACDNQSDENSTVKKDCPQKIASLSLASDEILLDIISDDRIIGITYLADNKKLSNVYEKTAGVPNRLTPNLEQIIELRPDIVIVADYIDFSFLHQIEKSGINTHLLGKLTSIESINQNIIALGEAVCEPEKTNRLVADLNKRLKYIEKRKLIYRPRVLYLFPSFFTAGSKTIINDLITSAGGINVAAGAGIEGNKKISREYVLNTDPDIILIGSYSPEEENFIETLKSDKVLESLSAISNNNVYTIEASHLTTVSHYIINGIEDLSEIIDSYNNRLDENKTKTSD